MPGEKFQWAHAPAGQPEPGSWLTAQGSPLIFPLALETNTGQHLGSITGVRFDTDEQGRLTDTSYEALLEHVPADVNPRIFISSSEVELDSPAKRVVVAQERAHELLEQVISAVAESPAVSRDEEETLMPTGPARSKSLLAAAAASLPPAASQEAMERRYQQARDNWKQTMERIDQELQVLPEP